MKKYLHSCLMQESKQSDVKVTDVKVADSKLAVERKWQIFYRKIDWVPT